MELFGYILNSTIKITKLFPASSKAYFTYCNGYYTIFIDQDEYTLKSILLTRTKRVHLYSQSDIFKITWKHNINII